MTDGATLWHAGETLLLKQPLKDTLYLFFLSGELFSESLSFLMQLSPAHRLLLFKDVLVQKLRQEGHVSLALAWSWGVGAWSPADGSDWPL